MLQEQNNANAQKMQQREVKDFWSDMSDDFIITVVEKKILKSKWEEIQKSYAESIADAAAQGTLESPEVKALKNAYSLLDSYLNSALKVFLNMEANTEISDRAQFNSVFSDFYAALNTAISTTDRKSASDDAATQITKAHTEHYIGVWKNSKLPNQLNDTRYGSGDWFVWGGNTCNRTDGLVAGNKLEKGHVYKWVSVNGKCQWQHLNASPANSTVAKEYGKEMMSALQDILNVKATGDGYFINLFAQSLFAQAAVIHELQTKLIQLEEGGIIRSDHFVSWDEETATKKAQGWQIKYNGDAEFNNIKVKGGTFKKITIDNESKFSGTFIIQNSKGKEVLRISGSPEVINGKQITYFPEDKSYHSGDDYTQWEYDCDDTRSYVYHGNTKIFAKKVKMVSNAGKRSDHMGTRKDSCIEWKLFIIRANGTSYEQIYSWSSGWQWDFQGYHGDWHWKLYYPKVKQCPVVRANLPSLSNLNKNAYPKGTVYGDGNTLKIV